MTGMIAVVVGVIESAINYFRRPRQPVQHPRPDNAFDLAEPHAPIPLFYLMLFLFRLLFALTSNAIARAITREILNDRRRSRTRKNLHLIALPSSDSSTKI